MQGSRLKPHGGGFGGLGGGEGGEGGEGGGGGAGLESSRRRATALLPLLSGERC